ncbi:MAG TPA: pyridoxamine 5'-phosphate oxidase family protein [Candidatus Limnocylindrales bacterium]|nr:pyridoxamine 5'-phosphate oxidase family protein [Candidatus Limnocylindrales bacterium]
MANTAKKTELAAVAKLLKELDICMLVTRAEGGALHGRPMSNNGEVEYDGDSWFFAQEGSRKVVEIDADPRVQMGFIDTPKGTWINVEGEAVVVRDDPERKRQLWQDDLERWFTNGPEDPDVVLIKVSARHLDAWAAEDEYSIDVR